MSKWLFIKEDNMFKVICDKVNKTTKIVGENIIPDFVVEMAMADPELEAIFANSHPSEYLSRIIQVAIRRKDEFNKVDVARKVERKHMDELETALKHIATEAGKAVHRYR